MKIPRPYNRYNVFFILERELLIQARKGKQTPPTSSSFNGYESLDLPPLPPRYQHLQSTLAPNWYAPGKQKLVKRKHNKSHGVASFREIPRIVAENWRAIDRDTKQFVGAVAVLLKERHMDISKAANGLNPMEANKSTHEERQLIEIEKHGTHIQQIPTPEVVTAFRSSITYFCLTCNENPSSIGYSGINLSPLTSRRSSNASPTVKHTISKNRVDVMMPPLHPHSEASPHLASSCSTLEHTVSYGQGVRCALDQVDISDVDILKMYFSAE